MQRCALGRVAQRPIFAGREEPSERPKIMSVHPFLKPAPQAAAPVEPYFTPAAQPAPRLRVLTALEQMYAYWGSDRA